MPVSLRRSGNGVGCLTWIASMLVTIFFGSFQIVRRKWWRRTSLTPNQVVDCPLEFFILYNENVTTRTDFPLHLPSRSLKQNSICVYRVRQHSLVKYGKIQTSTLEKRALKSIEVARKAGEIASDKQAEDIVVLDIREISSFADYFVICSGESDRQLNAILQEIQKKLKQDGIAPYRIDGAVDSGWIIIDLGDVIIHIFSKKLRAYYKLDEFWSKATPVLKIQ